MVELDHREERVVFEVVDDDLPDADTEAVEHALQQIVRHGARCRDLLELQRNGIRLEDPDPNGQRLSLIHILEDDDGHIRYRIQGDPAHRHLDQHGTPTPCPRGRRKPASRTWPPGNPASPWCPPAPA